MKNIIFIAPPAAGKGTQSEKLEKKYGYVHISTGDLLREEIKKGTELGREIKEIIDKGELVSDEIVTKMLKNKLAETKKNFILDGYPRVHKQAENLNKILDELNISKDEVLVIYLEINLETAIKRALGRLICSKCGASYHKYIKELIPTKEGYCNNCNSELIQRTDDNEETFKIRFQTYLNETEPLLTYYKEQNMLKIVDSNTNTDEVFKSIEQILTGERSNG
ncbi:MAG: adenylate kinase [Bacilli bacterium]